MNILEMDSGNSSTTLYNKTTNLYTSKGWILWWINHLNKKHYEQKKMQMTNWVKIFTMYITDKRTIYEELLTAKGNKIKILLKSGQIWILHKKMKIHKKIH